MGLVRCPDCSNAVSDNASMCPKCGCDFASEEELANGKMMQWMFGLFALFVFVVVLSAIVGGETFDNHGHRGW